MMNSGRDLSVGKCSKHSGEKNANEFASTEDKRKSREKLILPPINTKAVQNMVSSLPNMTPRLDVETQDIQPPAQQHASLFELDNKGLYDYQAVLGGPKTVDVSPMRAQRQMTHQQDYDTSFSAMRGGIRLSLIHI